VIIGLPDLAVLFVLAIARTRRLGQRAGMTLD
jgi:hypothetical protein